LTGMSFVDIRQLLKSEIVTIDGHQWIVSERKKTGIPFRVRLMEQSLVIIQRYQSDGRDLIFDRCEYHTVSKHLPAILRACAIHKHISFHCARHTFAIMALNHGMPIESVSRILGHSNITTTQIYAKITMKKLDGDFMRLEQGLAPVLSSDRSQRKSGWLKSMMASIVHLLFKTENEPG